MLKKELAKLLDISPAMVTKLEKRGMPTDTLERAQRWRKRHLEPGRIKGVRFDPSRPAMPTAEAGQALPPMQLHDQIRQHGNAIMTALRHGGFDEIRALSHVEARLRQTLRSGINPDGETARLPLVAWCALVEGRTDGALPDDLLEALGMDGGAMLTASDFAESVKPWADQTPEQWMRIASNMGSASREASD